MDVLNMSIGDAFNNWAGSPTAAAADALVDAGIVVVASIGNSGANGIYSAGAPGVGDKVIGVASFDNSHVQAPGFTVSPDDCRSRQRLDSNVQAPEPPSPRRRARPDQADAPAPRRADAAERSRRHHPRTGATRSRPDSSPGTVALIRRGACTFYVEGAERAGRGGDRPWSSTTTRPVRVTPLVTGDAQVDDPRRDQSRQPKVLDPQPPRSPGR